MLLPQVCPASMRWLSTTPSQSLSQPSQVSGKGPPAAQAGQVEVQHELATKSVQSSMTPLQSSSTPLHLLPATLFSPTAHRGFVGQLTVSAGQLNGQRPPLHTSLSWSTEQA